MSASPAYASTPHVSWVTLTAANNTYDGTGTVGTAFVAETNGSYLGFIKAKPCGTNVATVARFFVNNGSDNSLAQNNTLIGEMSLPATAGTATTALVDLQFQLNFAIQAGYKINIALGTAVAAGWDFTVVGGDL